MPSASHKDCAHNRGISAQVIEHIARAKSEPVWMREWRLAAFKVFQAMPLPNYGVDLSAIDFENICFYCRPVDSATRSWDDVPAAIKDTFEQLGIPKAEHDALAGLGVQFESEMLYKNLKATWQEQGVIFCSMDEAVQQYPELVQSHIGTIVPPHDNKFAALNSAVWSGGSFIYVPQGVTVELPVQAYFRMQQERMGQFERTLIIADKHSNVHYIEGCSAPLYSTHSLHSAVVEIIVHEHARVRYTTIQNWSTNVYNLVTKRAFVHAHAQMEWVDGNFGSAVTMKYPCMILAGESAKGSLVSLSVASAGQHQHTGAKVIHKAPKTTAHVVSKSMCKQSGIATYVGYSKVEKDAHDSKSYVRCDALMMDDESKSYAYPDICVETDDADIGHEASVSSLDQQQLTYLLSRGLTMNAARMLIVNGCVGSFVDELPLEYAIELNRLIALEINRSGEFP